MQIAPSRLAAEQLDAADALAQYRKRYFVPPGQMYLDGNSLGLLCGDAERSLLAVLEKWKTGGIGGWLEGDSPWFTMAEELSARVAKLVGAEADEVAIANSMTINLHQLLATLYRPRARRTKVLIVPDQPGGGDHRGQQRPRLGPAHAVEGRRRVAGKFDPSLPTSTGARSSG